METTTHEEMLEMFYGKPGTPKRDEFDARVAAGVKEYRIGKAIKEVRKKKGLTQEQLGLLMGVQKSQVSKIESGKGIAFSSVVRAFQALGAKAASLDLGELGKVALW